MDKMFPNTDRAIKKWKRLYVYNKYPIWLWKFLCFLKIKHNYVLVEFHTYEKGKPLKLEDQFGVYECVYCKKRRKE